MAKNKNKPYIYILDNDVDKNVLDVVQRTLHNLGTCYTVSYKNQFHIVEETDTADLYICLKRYMGDGEHKKNIQNNKRIYWNFSTYVENSKRKD
jgi:hypothetical protein